MSIRDEFRAARDACPGARYVSFNLSALPEALGYTAPWKRAGVPDVYEGLTMLCHPDQIEPVVVSDAVPWYYSLAMWFKVWSGSHRTCLLAADFEVAETIGAALFNTSIATAEQFTEAEMLNVPQTVMEFCNG